MSQGLNDAQLVGGTFWLFSTHDLAYEITGNKPYREHFGYHRTGYWCLGSSTCNSHWILDGNRDCVATHPSSRLPGNICSQATSSCCTSSCSRRFHRLLGSYPITFGFIVWELTWKLVWVNFNFRVYVFGHIVTDLTLFFRLKWPLLNSRATISISS